MVKYEKLDISGAVDQAVSKRKLELSEKQIAGLTTASQIVLGLAAVAGVITLAVLAPNAVQILGKVSGKRGLKSKEFRFKQKQKIKKTLYYLKESGEIKLTRRVKDIVVELTEKGKQKFRRLSFQKLSLPAPVFWNRHWWLILADIPSDTHKTHADQFRRKLKSLNCYPLQRTVWVYPFDIRGEIELIAKHYTLEKFVTMMEVIRLDVSDQKLLVDFFRKDNIIPS